MHFLGFCLLFYLMDTIELTRPLLRGAKKKARSDNSPWDLRKPPSVLKREKNAKEQEREK